MKTVILGAGRMGSGIGLCYALGGHDVVLVDREQVALAKAQDRVRAAATFLVDNALVSSAAAEDAVLRISPSLDRATACRAADLVQEAIPEVLEDKRSLFREIEPLVHRDAMIATNTSSLRLAALAEGMRVPERLIGMHWVSPPYLVPIVEVVRVLTTPAELVARAVAVLEAVGKVPVVVPDVPGFALNRLQFAAFAAAVDLVDQGIVGPAEVDLLVRYAIAPRQLAFGQLRLFDLIVNGSTVLAVSDYLFDKTGDPRYRPSPRLTRMVASGRLGLASGAGWFEYPGDPDDHEMRRDRAFAQAYRALAELDRLAAPPPGTESGAAAHSTGSEG